MEKEKIRFPSRVKIAVTKIEDYSIFINEKMSVGLKYFLLIIFIFSIILTSIETIDFSEKMNHVFDYIKNEMPDFSYINGNLEFHENINAYDSKFNFILISDTTKEGSNENIIEFSKQIENQGIILFKDKAIIINSGNRMILDYLQLQESYKITELDKQTLIEKIDSIGVFGITIMYFAIILLGLFVIETISLFMDCVVLSIFAYCTAKITKTYLNYKQIFNISIYSLTLPIILYMIYSIANFAFDFYTPYFKTIYLLIAYVYVVAVIFIIKSDLMKQKVEIGKVEEIKKEDITEETEDDGNKEDKKKNDREDEKDDNKKTNNNDEGNIIDGEPDGSEI